MITAIQASQNVGGVKNDQNQEKGGLNGTSETGI
jgi:hypothetical protein